MKKDKLHGARATRIHKNSDGNIAIANKMQCYSFRLKTNFSLNLHWDLHRQFVPTLHEIDYEMTFFMLSRFLCEKRAFSVSSSIIPAKCTLHRFLMYAKIVNNFAGEERMSALPTKRMMAWHYLVFCGKLTVLFIKCWTSNVSDYYPCTSRQRHIILDIIFHRSAEFLCNLSYVSWFGIIEWFMMRQHAARYALAVFTSHSSRFFTMSMPWHDAIECKMQLPSLTRSCT